MLIIKCMLIEIFSKNKCSNHKNQISPNKLNIIKMPDFLSALNHDLSNDLNQLNEIKEIGHRIEEAVSEYFYQNNLADPSANFQWEYILVDNKKIKNAV